MQTIQSYLVAVLLAVPLAGCGGDSVPGSGDDNANPDDPNDTVTDEEYENDSGFFPSDLPSVAQCDPFEQDCPSGEKCVPYDPSGLDWSANKCVEVRGDGQAGDACRYAGTLDGSDDCGPETLCWDVLPVEGEAIGVCTPFCEGTLQSPRCSGQTSCLTANDGSINVCVDSCDPLIQACGDGLGCFFVSGDFRCVFTAGEIPVGEPCGAANDCAPGGICAPSQALPACSASACCTSLCDVTNPQCALENTECTELFAEGTAPPEHVDVGSCIVPE